MSIKHNSFIHIPLDKMAAIRRRCSNASPWKKIIQISLTFVSTGSGYGLGKEQATSHTWINAALLPNICGTMGRWVDGIVIINQMRIIIVRMIYFQESIYWYWGVRFLYMGVSYSVIGIYEASILLKCINCSCFMKTSIQWGMYMH